MTTDDALDLIRCSCGYDPDVFKQFGFYQTN